MDRIRLWGGRLRVVAHVLTAFLVVGGVLVIASTALRIATWDPSQEPDLVKVHDSTLELQRIRANTVNIGGPEVTLIGPDPGPLYDGMVVFGRIMRGLGDLRLGAAAFVRLSVAAFVLQSFAALMRLYEQGIVFDAQNVKWMRYIGILSLIAAFLPTPDFDTHRIGFHVDLMEVYLGCFVWLLGWVMNEARKDREELDAVI